MRWSQRDKVVLNPVCTGIISFPLEFCDEILVDLLTCRIEWELLVLDKSVPGIFASLVVMKSPTDHIEDLFMMSRSELTCFDAMQFKHAQLLTRYRMLEIRVISFLYQLLVETTDFPDQETDEFVIRLQN